MIIVSRLARTAAVMLGALALATPLARPAQADGALALCLAARERACVLQHAAVAILDVEEPRWRSLAFLEIALVEAQAKETRSARAAMDRAVAAGPGASSQEAADRFAYALALVQGALGDFEAAERTIHGISDGDLKPMAQVEFAKAAIAAGDLARSVVLAGSLASVQRAELAWAFLRAGQVDSALQIADSLSDAAERWSLYADAAEGMVAAGDAGIVEQLASRITEAEGADTILGAVAAALAERGDLMCAWPLTDRIENEKARGHALYGIVRALTERGDLSLAQVTAADIRDDLWRSLAEDGIVVALLLAGNDAAAVALAARSHPDDEWARASAFETAVSRQAQRGDLPAAQRIARSITVPYWSAQAGLEIANAKVKMGDLKGARNDLEDVAQRVSRLGRELRFAAPDLALAQARAGDLEGASRSLQVVRNPWARSEAFADVATELAQQGLHALARVALERATWSAHGIEDDRERAASFRQIAATWAKIADAEGAAALFLALDPYDRAMALVELVPSLPVR